MLNENEEPPYEPSEPSLKDRHKRQAEKLSYSYPMHVNEAKCIVAHPDYVELRAYGKIRMIRYDITEENWKKQTGWE